MFPCIVFAKYILHPFVQFNPASILSEDDPDYNSSPTLNDKVHCLVCVIPSDKVTIISNEVVAKMREIRLAASDMGKGKCQVVDCYLSSDDVKWKLLKALCWLSPQYQGQPFVPFLKPGYAFHMNKYCTKCLASFSTHLLSRQDMLCYFSTQHVILYKQYCYYTSLARVKVTQEVLSPMRHTDWLKMTSFRSNEMELHLKLYSTNCYKNMIGGLMRYLCYCQEFHK